MGKRIAIVGGGYLGAELAKAMDLRDDPRRGAAQFG